MGYLYLLRRLAWICFKDMKYSEAERYFDVVAQLMPAVSNDNPISVFDARANHLRYLMHADLEKAMEAGQRLKVDVLGENPGIVKKAKEFFSVKSKKETVIILGNLHLLKGDYKEAKKYYREALATQSDDGKLGEVLNNLAVASWKHMKALDHVTSVAELAEEKQEAIKDAQYIITWFKQSIHHHEMKFEKDHKRKVNISKTQLIDALVNQEDSVVPADFSSANEDAYNACLESPESYIAMQNLTEYLLEISAAKSVASHDEKMSDAEQAQASKAKNDAAFWLKLSLKYFERVCPEKLDKQLVLLGCSTRP